VLLVLLVGVDSIGVLVYAHCGLEVVVLVLVAVRFVSFIYLCGVNNGYYLFIYFTCPGLGDCG